MSDNPYPNERDCIHGQFRKSCNLCEYERDIAELKKENELLRAVHYHARGVMRHNGFHKLQTEEAYKAMSYAVHCVNDYDTNYDNEDDDEETSTNDL